VAANEPQRNRAWGLAIGVGIVVGVVVVWALVIKPDTQQELREIGGVEQPVGEPLGPIVVYCAHDSIYSKQVLDRFTEQTGIEVEPRFDTEATKSLGLIELIVRERENPRCDVFWNNEQLGTMRLQSEGLLEPYTGPNHARIPASQKAADGTWAGFGARMRVWIVNTDLMEATEQAVDEAMSRDDLSHAAIAKPLYGTTRAHYTVLWDLWGEQKVKAWHQDWRDRGINEVSGNATTKNLVANGSLHLGLTDTDDYYLAVDAGAPVDFVPARVGRKLVVIPNTVAIIQGTEQLEASQKLVDFLLSEANELALAQGDARQIPLGPVDESKLPDEVVELKRLSNLAYPLGDLNDARAGTLEWLREEYVR